MSRAWAFGCGLLLLGGCGGGQQPAATADETATEAAAEPPLETTEKPPIPEAEANSETENPSEAKPPAVAEPVFTEKMSVAQAQAAIPQGAPRSNLEPEALAKPLQDPSAFEACKIGNAHFQVKVAIWDGKAVGIDLTTKPKNPKLEECLSARIRELSWPDRVRSLNTVEFQY
jgi:hypothetical protein